MKIFRKAAIIAALLLTAFSFLCGNAETVSQKQAKKLASQFFNALHKQVMGEPKLVWNGRKLTTDRLFNPFYVYNLPKGGYVVIAADNKAFPILAYNPEGKFDPDRIPTPFEALLKGYARDIELIRFDSRIPEQAIESWQNYPDYVDRLLSSRETSTEGIAQPSDALKQITAVYSDGDDDLFSDLYSPEQWIEMVNMELDKSGYVSLGFVSPKGIENAAVVDGRKGSYHKMTFDDNGTSAYCLLMATEYLSDGQLARLGYTIDVSVPETEEPPFAFYEAFVEENRRNLEEQTRAIEETLRPSTPVLKVHGSGRYSVELPFEACYSRIYNLGGAVVKTHHYKGSDTAYIDLTIQPSGFYFAEITDIHGNRYGLKLIR